MKVYFIKIDDNYYYGYNQCGKSIHKATFYKTEKYANEMISNLMHRPKYKDRTITIGKAEINEVQI